VLSGSLSRLSRIVGPKVATLIRAANKLLQSSLLDDVRSGPVLSSRAELIRYLHFQLGSLRHERVLALYLDHNLRLLYVMRVADGSVASASPEISRIIHIALDVGASGILVVHNHPSGDPSPSISDLNWTARLSRVAADLNVRLIDHIIVAGGEVRSALEA
jgi:DNA repair protein RadC